MFTFTLKGQTYNSEMSGNQVAGYLAQHLSNNSFVASLLSARKQWGKWTQSQGEWAHKLALDHKAATEKAATAQPANTNLSGLEFPQLIAFLSRPTKLKRIRLTFTHADGEVSIKKASTDEKGFWIAKNGQLVGQLRRDGKLNDRGITPDIACLLDEMESNPQAVAAEHGRKTGCCCFCGLPLTDERSTQAGYGPICAGHYNLPWG